MSIDAKVMEKGESCLKDLSSSRSHVSVAMRIANYFVEHGPALIAAAREAERLKAWLQEIDEATEWISTPNVALIEIHAKVRRALSGDGK